MASHPQGIPGGGGGRGTMPKQRARNTKETLLRLWQYLKRGRKGLILVAIFTFISTLFTLIGPYLIGTVAIDQYIIPHDYMGLAWVALLLLGTYIISSVASWLQGYIMAGVSQDTVRALKQDVFDHMQQLPLSFFDTRTHGELMSRATNDVESITNSLNQGITQFLNSLITVTGTLILMIMLNIPLTLISVISVPLVIIITGQIAKRTRKFFASQQTHLGQLNGYIEETVTGHKVVQAYVREQETVLEFGEINEQLRRSGTRAQIFSGLVGPVMNLLNNASYALIALVGGWLAFNGHTSVGIIVSFLNYSKQFSRPINDLANQFNLIQSALAGAERVFELIDEPSEYEHNERKKALQIMDEVHGEVVFHDVNFSYTEGVPILSNVSLHVQPGERIALVGPTGAGKTTVINLLTRFYEINSGFITIDGTDIRNLDKDSLRDKLGIVLQDAYLFTDTIRENIRYGRLDANDQQIEQAAQLANAHSFIAKLPQGYDTIMTAEGTNLSQGQRQLITIARAILANPAILILDEATSSVDTRTEMHIQQAMDKLMEGRTSFVIAHRLSTIKDADQIAFVSGGRIVECGTHEQLLERQGFYYELYMSQFKRTG